MQGWAKAGGGFSSWQVFLVGENDVSCDTRLLGDLRRIGERVDTQLLGAGMGYCLTLKDVFNEEVASLAAQKRCIIRVCLACKGQEFVHAL